MSTIKKILLVSSILALLGAGCNQQQAQTQTQPTQSSEKRAITAKQYDDTIVPPTPSAPAPAPKVADYVKYHGQESKNALEILKALYPNQVETKVYSGVGDSRPAG